jgi:hypothetical protein
VTLGRFTVDGNKPGVTKDIGLFFVFSVRDFERDAIYGWERNEARRMTEVTGW